MGLEDKIKESIILAMKAKDKTRLEALRAVKSAILLEKTKAGNKENLDENQIIKLLQKLVKQRNERAKIYKEQKHESNEKLLSVKKVERWAGLQFIKAILGIPIIPGSN